MNILILNIPCYGFGDIIFAYKFANYMKSWYKKSTITIATSDVTKFKQLIESDSKISLVELVPKKGTKVDCIKFKNLRLKYHLHIQDLIFIAPLVSDFEISYNDISSLLPYSDKNNTFFLSEYNDDLKKDFTLPTGIGKNRLGLLLSSPSKNETIPQLYDKSYFVVYIAENKMSYNCFFNFFKMICKKHHTKLNIIDLVIPHFIFNDIIDEYYRKKTLYNLFYKTVKKYFSSYNIISNDFISNNIINKNSLKPILNINIDIYPLKHSDMISLFQYSEKDILITGDQSLTDVLSCCPTKNIYYQTMPWKQDLAENLAKYFPAKFLKNPTQSCGLENLQYNSNYKKFIKDWDFRTKGKKIIDKIIYNFKSKPRKSKPRKSK